MGRLFFCFLKSANYMSLIFLSSITQKKKKRRVPQFVFGHFSNALVDVKARSWNLLSYIVGKYESPFRLSLALVIHILQLFQTKF